MVVNFSKISENYNPQDALRKVWIIAPIAKTGHFFYCTNLLTKKPNKNVHQHKCANARPPLMKLFYKPQ